MRDLYHYPLDAFGRVVRIYLHEKSLDYRSMEEFPWDRKKLFSENHVFSDLPTLIETDGTIIESAYSIIEHVEQSYRANALMGDSLKMKSEVRRISMLFNVYFFSEVTNNIIFEKIIKKYLDRSSPDSSSIRKGNGNLEKYFEYIAWLTNRRNWLAGNEFSLADISAAAQISCLDYVGSIEWEKYPEVKDWYVRIKSRPSFREILHDKIANVSPSSWYSNLDF